MATLLALLAGVAGAAVTEERTETLPWRSYFPGGAWLESGRLALRSDFPLGEQPVLWVEAEEASAVALRPGGAVAAEAGTGGGSFVRGPERLQVFLQVTQPGKYWVWHRLRLPQGGTVRHLQGVNASLGAPISWVSHDLPPGQWQWLRREHPWELRAGRQELQTDQWTAGVEVDCLALTADEAWQPPADGPGPAATAPQPWAQGVAYTADLFPTTVLRWGRVELPAEVPPGARVALACSTDGGQSWFPAPEGGDLGEVAVRGDGTDRLRFRVTLTRGPDAGSPEVGPLQVTYTGEREDLVYLEDSAARFAFAARTGALAGIQHKGTGNWLTPFRRPQPIFSVRLRPVAGAPQSEWETVTSLEARCTVAGQLERGGARRFVYEIARADGTATVTLRAAPTGPGELTWTARVDNRLAEHEVVDLTYPIAHGVRLSPDPAADTLLINGNYLVPFPATFGHFLYYWPTNTAPLMDVHNAQEGLTVVARDPTMRSTGLSCRGLDREAVELSLVKIVRVRPGESFEGAPHLMRVHPGDWHTTALIEREWLARTFPTPEPPLWLAENEGWIPAGWPMGWYTDLPESVRRMRRDTGFGWVQYWNFQVPGTVWTIPHPNPLNGTEEDLRWAIDQVHRQGMRMTFYIQGLLCDPEGDGSAPEDPIGHLQRRHLWPGWELPEAGFAERWAARNADGEVRHWSPRELEMCYASPGFQEYKRHWALDRLMGRLGADGIYWDSLSIGRTCWGTDHGHGDDPGRWGIGAQENHALILEEARRLNPTAVFATEGPPVDTLGQVIDVHLNNAPSLDVVRFLFPRMLIYLGSADGADVRRRKAFLYGCRFDGIERQPDQEALLAIRRATSQYLYPATPLNTLGLTVEGAPSVQARNFRCEAARTQGALVTLLNEERARGATVTVDTSEWGPVRRAWVVEADGYEGPLRGGEVLAGGRAYRFPVPEAFASTVLLLRSAEPRVTVEPADVLARGGESSVTVRLESLTGERRSGTVRLLTPRGLSSAPVRFSVSEALELAQELTLPLRADERAPLGLVDLPVEVRAEGIAPFRRVATVYVERPVRVTAEWVGPEKLRVTASNRSQQSREGSVRLQMVDGEVAFAGGAPRWDFRLGPGEEVRWDTRLRGAADCPVPWSVRAEVTSGRDSWTVYQPFRAPLLNGSFERFTFRTDLPDYWWGTHVDRAPRLWGTGEFALDDTLAAEGTHSLKLVGQADEWRAVNLDLVLQPGRTYRFRAQIRRSEHAPNLYAAIVENRRTAAGELENVTHVVGRQTEGPVGEWQSFETTFTALPREEYAGCRLYLYNINSPAIAWFDGLRLVPEEPGA